MAAHMPDIKGSVIQCVGEQVLFALDLNGKCSRELHTQAASGTSARVRFRCARGICLHLDRHCTALTD